MRRCEDVDLQMYYNGFFFYEEPFAGALGILKNGKRGDWREGAAPHTYCHMQGAGLNVALKVYMLHDMHPGNMWGVG